MSPIVRPPARLNRKKINISSKDSKGKNAPPGLKLILIGVPIVVFSSYGIYKRLYLKQEKKEQLGELDSEGKLRLFTKEEIKRRNEQSWFSRLFGDK